MGFFHFLQMAEQQFPVVVSEVHSVAFAVAEHRAVGALAFAHPLSISIRLKSGVPDLPKIIFVDVTLMVVASDARTSRDRAINQHRGYIHARITTEEIFSYIAFVIAQESLAAIAECYARLLFAILLYVVKHLAKLLLR